MEEIGKVLKGRKCQIIVRNKLGFANRNIIFTCFDLIRFQTNKTLIKSFRQHLTRLVADTKFKDTPIDKINTKLFTCQKIEIDTIGLIIFGRTLLKLNL